MAQLIVKSKLRCNNKSDNNIYINNYQQKKEKSKKNKPKCHTMMTKKLTSSETIQLGCKLAVYYFWGKQKTLRKLGNLITCNLGWSNEKC